MTRLPLAPEIQEEILAALVLNAEGEAAPERMTRAAVRIPLWGKRRKMRGRLKNHTVVGSAQ